MKRILILGSVGSGKSTLANRLHGKFCLPVVCLDQYFWKPNWQPTEDPAWRRKVEQLSQAEEWFMDGNFLSTLDIRLPRADTIIFLDRNRFVCLCGFLKRIFGKRRHGAIEGCRESLNIKMLIWILWKFPRHSRGKILAKLEKVRDQKNVFILKSSEDVKEFLLGKSFPK